MTRMGKVLFALLVLMLTCSLAIGVALSKDKMANKGGKKLIKIWLDKDTGKVLDAKLGKDDGSDQDATMVSPTTSGTVVGTILFHKSSPGCIVIVAGGYAWQICW